MRFGLLLLLAWAGAASAEPTQEELSLMTDPDYRRGVAAVEAKDWSTAIRFLSSAELRDARNADLQNYLGYAYRNAGDVPSAFKHYSRALELNPRHRGAHEYLGEAYLMIRNLPKAEEHLAQLRSICASPCAEVRHLEKKIAEFSSVRKPQ